MKNKIITAALILVSIAATAQTWTPNKKYIAPAKTTTRAADTIVKYQCYGTCKDGHRCNRKVKINGDYCYQHSAQK